MSNNIENRTQTRRENWGTPQDLFDKLDEIFDFEIDLAADPLNRKCRYYYSIDDDFFNKPIMEYMAYCNPPYSRTANKLWPSKLMEYPNVVVLHQASVGARWFQTFWKHANILCFPVGRLQFEGAPGKAQYDSVIVARLRNRIMIAKAAKDLKKIGNVVRLTK